MATRPRYPASFDPYLIYGIETGFRNFAVPVREEEAIKLLVALDDAASAARFERAVRARDPEAFFTRPPRPARFVSMHCDRALLLRPANWAVFAATLGVERVELSLPVRVWGDPAAAARAAARPGARTRSRGALLLGVIDDGCAFAHTEFLRPGALSTRVLALWDQDGFEPPRGAPAPGKVPPGFGYGAELVRADLDRLIARHRTPWGIDEDACYVAAGCPDLRFRAAHGTHVMDLLGGRMPLSARIGRDRVAPPSWHAPPPARDPAAAADLVFVQIPRAAVDDASGRWLDTHVLDGVRYILEQAGPDTEKVVVNISYGPVTGPHDGRATLEQALRELARQYRGTGGRPELHIVLCAGNSYLAQEHVHTTLAGAPLEWTWNIPPANPVAAFAEIWMDAAAAARVELRAPDGRAGGRVIERDWNGSKCWMLAVGPTVTGAPRGAGTFDPAPHGAWTVRLIPGRGDRGRPVDAYAARSDPNMGARTGAKAARFVDLRWARRDGGAFAQSLPDMLARSQNGVRLVSDLSLVKRAGTLNGIATDRAAGVHVAGGYRLIDGRKAVYASAGPTRGVRTGPDYGLPCDETWALRGVRAAGTRSGGHFRLVGTSTGAPQLARHLANGALPPPAPPPQPDTRGLGRGNLPVA